MADRDHSERPERYLHVCHVQWTWNSTVRYMACLVRPFALPENLKSQRLAESTWCRGEDRSVRPIPSEADMAFRHHGAEELGMLGSWGAGELGCWGAGVLGWVQDACKKRSCVIPAARPSRESVRPHGAGSQGGLTVLQGIVVSVAALLENSFPNQQWLPSPPPHWQASLPTRR